jgi:hypothetical protein
MAIKEAEVVGVTTEAQLARQLRIAPTTLGRWRRRGEAPPHLVLPGRTIAYRNAAVQGWLLVREAAATPAPPPPPRARGRPKKER